MDGGEVTEISWPSMRRGKALVCVVCAGLLLLLLGQMARQATNAVIVGYMAIVAAGVLALAIGAVRSFRIGFYLSDEGLVARTVYSTKSWRWDQISRADSMDLTIRRGTSNLVGGYFTGHEERVQVIPVIRRRRGTPVVLRGLKVQTSSNEYSNWVDDAVRAINDRLEAR
jgi:hypothetical protein